MKQAIQNFEGLVPRLSSRDLGKNQAQVARNCDLRSGDLRAIKQPSVVTTVPSGTQTIFPWNNGWETWTTDVDVVRNPIANDQYSRIHYTGDGAPKVKGLLSGVESTYDLGIPVPTNAPTGTAAQKTTLDWTRAWHYYYEDADGTVTQEGTLTEGVEVIEVTLGVEYKINTFPARVAAGADDTFVLWVVGTDSDGSDLGRVYPTVSKYGDVLHQPVQSDLHVDGAHVTADQINKTSTPNVTFTIHYDTSRASDYKIERSYIYTFLTAFDEEGPPSAASAVVSVDPSQNCVVTGFDTSVSGDYNITKIRLYRTVVDSNGYTQYLYVTEQDIGTTTFTDTLKDSQTGERCPSIDDNLTANSRWIAPPSDLAGLVEMPGGFLAGFSGNDVYFSVPWYPHAWPLKYRRTVDSPVKAMGVTENSLIVMHDEGVRVLTGFDPESIGETDGTLMQPCSSKRSVVQVSGVLLYACPDGLVGYKGGVGELLTREWYTEDQWADISPTTMFATVHDETYYAWTDTSQIIFSFREGRRALTTTDETANGLYTDESTDTMYVIQGTNLMEWEGGTNNLQMTWKSKLFQLSRPEFPMAALVNAESYTVAPTFNFYANGTLVKAIAFTSDEARLLPDMRREYEWEFEIVSTSTINEIIVADDIGDIQSLLRDVA